MLRSVIFPNLPYALTEQGAAMLSCLVRVLLDECVDRHIA